MKRILIIAIVFFFVIQAGFGQSKVAVLDASLGEGVHPNAAAIVADTINEQFVKALDFIAIDRAYISSIQAEKQFQLSGEVADQDIKELGATFGADFLCIANVSLLGSTYTVSARLIEVSSAQVVAQESDRQQGEIDVLFTVAEVVGSKFVGTKLKEETVPQVVEEPEPEPVQETPPPAPAPKPERKEAKGRVTFGFMFPGYTGAEDFMYDESYGYYTLYELDEYALDLGYYDASNTTWGIDVSLLMPINRLYWSLGVSYTNQSLVAEYEFSEYTYEIFSTLDATAGVGVVFPILSSMQFFAGANLGFMLFTLGSDYSGDATGPFWMDDGESASGLVFGGEAGADFFLGNICISLKYKLSLASDLTGDYTFTDAYEDAGGDTSLGVHGFSISAGYGL